MKQIIKLFLLSIICLTSCNADAENKKLKDIRVELNTSKGKISMTLYPSKTPITVANFLNLAKRGFYNDLTFHRVVPNFMIQGGDPMGNGSGGPGYTIPNEAHPDLNHDGPGKLAMARRRDPDSAGSQFYITHKATSWLDNGYTVFGSVTEGQEVVDKIARGDKILSIKILDSTDQIFDLHKDQIKKWNVILDAKK